MMHMERLAKENSHKKKPFSCIGNCTLLSFDIFILFVSLMVCRLITGNSTYVIATNMKNPALVLRIFTQTDQRVPCCIGCIGNRALIIKYVKVYNFGFSAHTIQMTFMEQQQLNCRALKFKIYFV